MGVRDHRELIVWQKAMDLVEGIYEVTGGFPKAEIYGLTSQMRRAAVSIPSNIAEGNGRRTAGDYVHYLAIANGSLKELETQIEIANRLHFCNDQTLTTMLQRTAEIGRLLTGLRKSLQNKRP